MKAKDVIASGLPWLKLDVSFPHERLLEEARRQAGRYVSHRSNGRGWKSLCLHGIGPTHTLAATSYGFASEQEAPHRWTEVAESCPDTVAFIKSLPARRLFRVRFMMLEPGGFIAPHQDSTTPRLGPINLALNQPEGCLFKMEGAGVIPFVAGSAFLIDISNRHSLINLGRTARFHIIVHGTFEDDDPQWTDLVQRSHRRFVATSTAKEKAPARPRAKPPASPEEAPSGSRFLIFALARTGSTTLSRLLQCHPGIHCLGEPFNPVLYEGEYSRRATDRDSLDAVMAEIWGGYNAVKHVWHPAGWPFGDDGALNEHMAAHGDYPVLLLTRRNALRRLVSLQISHQTNVWILDSEEARRKFEEFPLQSIEPSLLRAQLENEERVVARYKARLAETGKPFMHLNYEDLFGPSQPIERKLDRLKEILAFLGRAPITDPGAIRRASRLFDPSRWTINSERTYRRIPGIERIEEELGSDETGWLFERS